MESLMQGPSLLSCFGGGLGLSVQDTRARSMALHSSSSSSSSSSSTSPFSSFSSDPYGDGAGACKLPASSFSYGRLQTLHEEEEDDDDEDSAIAIDGNVGGGAGEEYECDEWMMLDMARWRRRHVSPEEQEEVQEAMAMAATALLREEEEEEEEDDDDDEIQKKMSNGRLGLGVVVRSRLKSSTRRVAAKIKQLLIAAHEGSPHVADLFLHNHLLVHQLTGSCLSPPPP